MTLPSAGPGDTRPAAPRGWARFPMRKRPTSGPLHRVVLAAEGTLATVGLWQIFDTHAAGLPLSRPGLIAAVAGVVAFIATLLAPAIRERRARRSGV